MNQFGRLVPEKSPPRLKHRRHMQTYARILPRRFPLLSPTTSGSSTVVVLPLTIARNWVSGKVFFKFIYIHSPFFYIRTARQQDVDGFLVGGASLKPEFADIINARKAWTSEIKPNSSCIFLTLVWIEIKIYAFKIQYQVYRRASWGVRQAQDHHAPQSFKIQVWLSMI